MKKCMILVLAIAAAGVSFGQSGGQPIVPPEEDFWVLQNKDGITLTISSYKGSARNIIIP